MNYEKHRAATFQAVSASDEPLQAVYDGHSPGGIEASREEAYLYGGSQYSQAHPSCENAAQRSSSYVRVNSGDALDAPTQELPEPHGNRLDDFLNTEIGRDSLCLCDFSDSSWSLANTREHTAKASFETDFATLSERGCTDKHPRLGDLLLPSLEVPSAEFYSYELPRYLTVSYWNERGPYISDIAAHSHDDFAALRTTFESLDESSDWGTEDSEGTLRPPLSEDVRLRGPWNPLVASKRSEFITYPQFGTQSSSRKLDTASSEDHTSTEAATTTTSDADSTQSTAISCGQCGLEFTGAYRRGNLARHVRQRHAEPTLRCEVVGCSKYFHRMDKLRDHVRHAHKGDVSSNRGGQLKFEGCQDLRSRSPGVYCCTEPRCQVGPFIRRADLLRHQRTHLTDSERPYKCGKCPQSFLYPKDLRRHEKTHDDSTKPILFCPYDSCSFGPGGQGFSRRDNLQRHIKRAHPNAV